MSHALTKPENGQAVIMNASTHMDDALKQWALVLSEPNLPATTVANLWACLKEYEKLMDTVFLATRERVRAHVEQHGEMTGDKGSREARVGDYILTLRVKNTQLDPKRIEALLRARQLDPSQHMDVLMTYGVNQDKLDGLVERGILTRTDIEGCRHEVDYAVQKPRKAK